MLFMNTWDIDEAADRYKKQPVLDRATRLLVAFRDLIDANSDGWAYWRLAPKAAEKLMTLIKEPETASEAKLKAAITPLKAFCTRHKLRFPEESLDTPKEPEVVARFSAMYATPEQVARVKPYHGLLRNPEKLEATTTAGEVFNAVDHSLLAYTIWKRAGMNPKACGHMWRRMMENNCPDEDVMALVAYWVFEVGTIGI